MEINTVAGIAAADRAAIVRALVVVDAGTGTGRTTAGYDRPIDLAGSTRSRLHHHSCPSPRVAG